MTREEAIDLLDTLIGMVEDSRNSDYDTAFRMGIKALEQEPCEDAISRQIIYDYVESHIQEINTGYGDLNKHTNRILRMIMEYIDKLPSVAPQPKTGHWEWAQYDYNPNIGNWHCSECKNIAVVGVKKNEEGGIPIYKYCPNCGAKMIEPQESEEVYVNQ